MTRLANTVRMSLVAGAWIGVCATACGQCGVNWSTQFGATTFSPGALTMLAHNDGSGPALYVGPVTFSSNPVNLARYRGTGLPMETVGGAFDGSIRALAVYNDGTGPALYAAGDFIFAGGVHVNHIAKWNGSTWSNLGSGLDGSVSALAVFNDGSGPALFVGGQFSNAGLVPAARLAKWNGSTWAGNPSIGGSNPSPYYTNVTSLTVFNAGTVNRLFIAGSFTSIGGVAAQSIASFDGTTLAPLGTGFPNQVAAIEDLQVYDPGTGPALYACGYFSSAGGVPANNVARWNGAAWSALGSGTDGEVHSLCVWNTSAGPRLVAGGEFSTAGGIATGGVALFDGSAWSSANAAGRTALVVGTFNPGGGEQLYTVGMILAPPNPNGGGAGPGWTYTPVFQTCSGTAWTSPTGQGIVGDRVSSLESHDDGSGPQLYAAGAFFAAGGNYAQNARWNGTAWSAVGLSSPSLALKSFNDGTGPALYSASGLSGVEKWNGTSATAVGGVFDFTPSCFAVHDPGSGPALHAGGSFTSIGGVAINHVARWTGSSWVPLGSGMSGGPSNTVVNAMTVFNDGTGPALYAAGSFGFAGGVAANSIAKWNGTAWSALGLGITGGNATVQALAVYNDGTGPALYAGGIFTTAGGVPCLGLAKWNGLAWSQPFAVGPAPNAAVFALRVFDDATGPKLYVTGSFAQAGATPANNVARWNGTSIEALGSGIQSGPAQFGQAGFALAVYDSGFGPSVFLGGIFSLAGGSSSSLIAEIMPARPRLAIFQPGGAGTGVSILDTALKVSFDTYNIFSLEPAPAGPGTGPYAGLYASNVNTLLSQVSLPVGSVPFHFTASATTATFGPYVGVVLPGTVIEGLALQVGGCFSTVTHYVVQ